VTTADADTPAAIRRSRLATNSAEAMAALRAAGAAERDPLLRNPDYMATDFLSARLKVQTLAKVPAVRWLIPALAERLLPGGYHYEAARVKHVDAILLAELKAGLDQLLILGAGYDSRPYRFADALQGVSVYEVDLPSISAVKRSKTKRIVGRLPSQVHYIEADLSRDPLHDRLVARSYRPDDATLIILSGVSPYLQEDAVRRLFDFVRRHTSPRTSIVFDYVYREMVHGDDSFHGAAQTRKRLEALGEPLKFGIPIGGSARFLEPFGLTLASDLQPEDLARRYLSRADGTVAGRPYGFAAIAHARVTDSRSAADR
jgi:methyltransferase (TIGR00027 family)